MATEPPKNGNRGGRFRMGGPRERRLGMLPLQSRTEALRAKPSALPETQEPERTTAVLNDSVQPAEDVGQAAQQPVAEIPRGQATASPVPMPVGETARKRVLFVCIGNSCRSQMAEAFAARYGADAMIARSAGVSPAITISPVTRQVLEERNLNIDDHFPKGLDLAGLEKFDLVVNMSGEPVSMPGARTIEWTVADPIGQPVGVYQAVANQIERLVMRLILELRTKR